MLYLLEEKKYNILELKELRVSSEDFKVKKHLIFLF
jgi:hypothetical protein